MDCDKKSLDTRNDEHPIDDIVITVAVCSARNRALHCDVVAVCVSGRKSMNPIWFWLMSERKSVHCSVL